MLFSVMMKINRILLHQRIRLCGVYFSRMKFEVLAIYKCKRRARHYEYAHLHMLLVSAKACFMAILFQLHLL